LSTEACVEAGREYLIATGQRRFTNIIDKAFAVQCQRNDKCLAAGARLPLLHRRRTTWRPVKLEDFSLVTYNPTMIFEDQRSWTPRWVPAARARWLGVLLCLFGMAPAVADIVYKTVGEDGVVSYTDTPPAPEEQVETLVIEVREPQLQESAREQLEDLRETTDRMVADRQQREKHRAELRQADPRSQPPIQVIEYGAPAGSSGSYPVYYTYPVYCPGVGYLPGPAYPTGRPPYCPRPPVQLPGSGIISPGYDYPASLIRRGYSPEVRAAFEK
jgi:hypothetical protein